jgi:hypothetical protein
VFAVREVGAEGIAPQFDAAIVPEAVPANRNERPAIFWAGRA